MSKDTKKNRKGTGNRISKTRQTKKREEDVRSTLRFGMKLVLILAVVIGCTQLFFYGKNVTAVGSSEPAPKETITKEPPSGAAPSQLSITESPTIETPAIESSTTESLTTETPTTEPPLVQGQTSQDGPSDSGLAAGKAVSGPSLSGAEADQQTPETIAPFAKTSDGPGNVVQAAPPSGESPLSPAGAGNELFPVSGPVDASRPMIAFTFDDGPYYSVDKRILDTLQAYGGRATFFIVGSRVNDYKDTLKRIRDSGSEIGNHTFNHKNLEKISPEEVASQIEMTNDAVEAVTGFRPKLVRVPYGAFQGQVPGLVSYPMIQWNIDTQDWSSKDKDAIAAALLSQAKDGSIVLMHDLYSATADAFEMVIPLLAAQGYQFVTVSEMYAAKGMPLEAGQVYFNIRN